LTWKCTGVCSLFCNFVIHSFFLLCHSLLICFFLFTYCLLSSIIVSLLLFLVDMLYSIIYCWNSLHDLLHPFHCIS
jgi:hypothetical protein